MKSEADKLKRILTLALDPGAADGEAMNALRAARSLVKKLGGIDKAMAAISGGSGIAFDQQLRPRGHSAWEAYRPQSNFWDGMRAKTEPPKQTKEQREADIKNMMDFLEALYAKAHKSR